jgi:hypothetical protein
MDGIAWQQISRPLRLPCSSSASVTVAGGAVTAVLSILTAGVYTVNPTTLTAEPVTGASLAGATLSIKMGWSRPP